MFYVIRLNVCRDFDYHVGGDAVATWPGLPFPVSDTRRGVKRYPTLAAAEIDAARCGPRAEIRAIAGEIADASVSLGIV